jgi:glycosyltransferase involved in cell wall biosynthesis
LAQLARSLGIAGAVHFTGYLSNERNLHRLLEVSVLCSLSEGFPNAVIEAMAAGRPVVATNVGGIPDAVRDGETGVLVPPGNPDALAGAIELLLRDPERRRTLGGAAQRIARREYHVSTVMASLEALYDRLLRRAPLTAAPHGEPVGAAERWDGRRVAGLAPTGLVSSAPRAS